MASSKPSSLDDLLSSQLARRKERSLFRSLGTPANEQGLVDFSSNDYLSLSRNPEIKQEYISFLQQQQQQQGDRLTQLLPPNKCSWAGPPGDDDFRLGSGGSRLLDGNSSLAETLERSLAAFHGAPAGLLFNSGYEANTGLFSAVPQAGDVVVYDEFIHASVHAGMKLSRAAGRTVKFRHNSVFWDDDQDVVTPPPPPPPSPSSSSSCLPTLVTALGNTPASLDAVLRQVVQGRHGHEIRQGRRHVFVAVEAVYSMDGDLAPLHDIVRCVEKHLPLGNGHVIVDEAHSNGVFGPGGRGLVCELGLQDRIWATILTFGKAMGCSGAIVLCTSVTRSYLINYARSLIYTTAMGFPALASIHVAHRYVASGRADAARRRLFALIQHMRARLTALCGGGGGGGDGGGGDAAHNPFAVPVINMRRKVGETTEAALSSQSSPILPVFTPKARSLAAFCRSRGFMVRPIVAPTVPLGTDRVRICLHAGNSFEECEGLCEAIEEWVRLQLQVRSQSNKCPGNAVVPTSPEEEHLSRLDIKARL